MVIIEGFHQTSREEVVAKESNGNGPLSFLVIDDDPEVIRLIAYSLSVMIKDGQKPTFKIKEKPEVALKELPDELEKGEFDAIFLDWKMPVLDGVEVARRIRSIDKAKKIPIIMGTTGKNSKDFPDSEVRAEAGIDTTVDKYDLAGDPLMLLSVTSQQIKRRNEVFESLDGNSPKFA